MTSLGDRLLSLHFLRSQVMALTCPFTSISLDQDTRSQKRTLPTRLSALTTWLKSMPFSCSSLSTATREGRFISCFWLQWLCASIIREFFSVYTTRSEIFLRTASREATWKTLQSKCGENWLVFSNPSSLVSSVKNATETLPASRLTIFWMRPLNSSTLPLPSCAGESGLMAKVIQSEPTKPTKKLKQLKHCSAVAFMAAVKLASKGSAILKAFTNLEKEWPSSLKRVQSQGSSFCSSACTASSTVSAFNCSVYGCLLLASVVWVSSISYLYNLISFIVNSNIGANIMIAEGKGHFI